MFIDMNINNNNNNTNTNNTNNILYSLNNVARQIAPTGMITAVFPEAPPAPRALGQQFNSSNE